MFCPFGFQISREGDERQNEKEGKTKKKERNEGRERERRKFIFIYKQALMVKYKRAKLYRFSEASQSDMHQ